MLDLGAWVAIQSDVENEHRMKVMQSDVLSESSHSAFWHLNEETLTSIHDRWVSVLDLMVKGEGDNQNIETHRGKNNHAMMSQDENLNADDNEGEINSDVESVFTYGDEDGN